MQDDIMSGLEEEWTLPREARMELDGVTNKTQGCVPVRLGRALLFL